MLAVPWPAFVAGLATGALVVWRFLVVRVRTGFKVKNPLLAWRSLNPHEVSFLRRVWRVGFILEEDDALRQERPERVKRRSTVGGDSEAQSIWTGSAELGEPSRLSIDGRRQGPDDVGHEPAALASP